MTRKIINKSKEILLVDQLIEAETFFSRLKGLLGRKDLGEGQGILIRPCNSVHTVGMKFSIDVAFVDKNGKVVHLIRDMKPGKFSPLIRESKYVLEVKSGSFSVDRLALGDFIGLD